MTFFIFLILFIIFLIFFYFLVRFLFNYFAYLLLQKFFKIEKDHKLFSYTTISKKANFCDINAHNVNFSIDANGLLSTKFNFLELNIETISFDDLNDPNASFSMPSHTVSDNIYVQVCIHILTLIVKRVQINIKNLIINSHPFSIKLSNIKFKYAKDFSFAFQLDISHSKIKFCNSIEIDIEPITFSPQFGVDPILSLINLEALLLPYEFKLSQLQYYTKKDEFKLDPIDISINLPRGIITLTTPEIRGNISPEFPELTIRINDISGFISRALFNIPHLILHVTKIHIKELEVLDERTKILYINNFHGSSNNNDPWKIYCRDLKLFYHMSTNIRILPFVNNHIFPILRYQKGYFEPNVPNCSMLVDHLKFIFKITDNTSLKIKGDAIKIKNRIVKLPHIGMFINNFKVISVKLTKIFVDDDLCFQVHCNSIHFHDRTEIVFCDVVTEIKLGIHTILPYIYSTKPDEESLKFPFAIKSDQIIFKFHDTDINQSITRASKIIPIINRESFIRKFLLKKKVQELKLSGETVQEAESKLTSFAFNDFKNRIAQEKKYKYIFHIDLQNCNFLFSSRNFTDKIQKIHQIDPTTKIYYPNLNWDVLVGFDFTCSFSSINVFTYDLEIPLIKGQETKFKGPIIIAQPSNDDLVPASFTIDGERIFIKLNPASVVIFTDMLIGAKNLYWHYGDCFQGIYQDMAIRLYNLLPYSVDPSPRFTWFDALRAVFRGQFLFKIDSFEIRLPSTPNFRELDNYIPLRFDKFNLLCREGDITLHADRWVSPRVYKGKDGPFLIDLPHIVWTFRFHWVSDGDSKRYILFPETSKFNDSYDSYSRFRAKGIVFDDATLFISKTEAITPIITIDIAHFEWLLQPLIYLYNKLTVKSRIKNKYGISNIQNYPETKFFIQIKKAGNIKIIGDMLILRVFDHFPISGGIQGSSIDFSVNDFTSLITFSYYKDECLISSKFRAQSLSINATDLLFYASGAQTRSPTFLVMKPLIIESGEQNTIDAEEVLVHINQLLLNYIIDFVSSIKVVDPILKNLSIKDDAQISDFPFCKCSLTINRFRVFLTSFEYDLKIVTVLESTEIDFLSDKEENGSYGISFESEQISIYSGNPDPGSTPIVTALDVDTFYIYNKLTNAIGSLSIKADKNDISIIKFLNSEYMPDQQSRSMVPSMVSEMTLFVKIPNTEIKIIVDDSIAEFDLETVTIGLKQSNDNTREINVIVMNATVRNKSTENILDPEVLAKWTQQSVVSANRPHVQLLLKMPPKMRGAYIFSQAEVNMEPSIIKYDSVFWESFVAFLNATFPRKPPKIKRQFTIRGASFAPIPFVVYDKSLFPEIQSQINYQTSKTLRVKKMHKNDEKIKLMFRYLRINPISMNVTYKNPNNVFISEINNFQGQMHEIIYHDLTTTTSDLISKLTYDVAKDILPQLVKHVVGFKKPDVTPEQAIEEWLKSGDKRMSKEDKQKYLLFGSKTFKKK